MIAGVADDPPYAQGYALADWLRSQPGIVAANGRANPDDILWRWQVLNSGVALTPRTRHYVDRLIGEQNRLTWC